MFESELITLCAGHIIKSLPSARSYSTRGRIVDSDGEKKK